MHFILLLFLLALASGDAQAKVAPLPEQPDSDIGYPTPEAALKALRAKPGVRVSESDDWFVVEDKAESTLWTFTKPSHPAHPSAVKRALIQRDGALFLSMQVKCGSSKEACDTLVREYQELNAQMTEQIESQGRK